jgi:predicted AlkP superfamily phosphohydrolase/phosphomutase
MSENSPGAGPEPSRVFVLGLDGVPWNLVEGWVDDGELPNFARLIHEGASGPLESTTPPTTPLAWPAIATGTWPDKHGVYGFQRLSPDYRHRMYTSRDLRQPALWELLSPALVGNVPMTYPATELDGRMVTGMMTPELDERSTHPPSLRPELERRLPSYRIGLDWSEYRDREPEFREALADLVGTRRELMRWFMETDDWRLFFFVYTAPDRLQHLVWEASALLEHYRVLDDILGEVLSYAAERDAVLFVVSDHGFGPLSKLVHVNRILEEAGYLTRREQDGTRGVLSQLGVSREGVQALLGRLNVSDELLLKYLPRSFVDRVAERIPGSHALYDVDHGRTDAFVFGFGTLYVNDTRRFEHGRVSPERVPAVKADLQRLLGAVTDPDTGAPALEVTDGDELFPTDPDGPDLVVEGRDGYEVATSLVDDPFVPTDGRMAAGHRSEGVLFAWGDPVEPGGTVSDATVVDVAPTLLHCVGEPVGESMDGRVLNELFRQGTRGAERAVSRRAYDGQDHRRPEEDPAAVEGGDVEDRLRGLGYIE